VVHNASIIGTTTAALEVKSKIIQLIARQNAPQTPPSKCAGCVTLEQQVASLVQELRSLELVVQYNAASLSAPPAANHLPDKESHLSARSLAAARRSRYSDGTFASNSVVADVNYWDELSMSNRLGGLTRTKTARRDAAGRFVHADDSRIH